MYVVIFFYCCFFYFFFLFLLVSRVFFGVLDFFFCVNSFLFFLCSCWRGMVVGDWIVVVECCSFLLCNAGDGLADDKKPLFGMCFA